MQGNKPQDKVSCETYRVVVDYDKSLADMIAAGPYDWTDSWEVREFIAEHFPVSGEGQKKVELQLVHLNWMAID